MEAAVSQQCSGEAMPSRCAGSSITRTTLTSAAGPVVESGWRATAAHSSRLRVRCRTHLTPVGYQLRHVSAPLAYRPVIQAALHKSLKSSTSIAASTF